MAHCVIAVGLGLTELPELLLRLEVLGVSWINIIWGSMGYV